MGRKKQTGFVAGATVFGLPGAGVAFAAIPTNGNVFNARLAGRDGSDEATISLLGSFTGPGTVRLACTGFNIFMQENSDA
jgi:hypothetical protein